jgi:hypothetical protein
MTGFELESGVCSEYESGSSGVSEGRGAGILTREGVNHPMLSSY